MSQPADCDFVKVATELQAVSVVADHAEFSDIERVWS